MQEAGDRSEQAPQKLQGSFPEVVADRLHVLPHGTDRFECFVLVLTQPGDRSDLSDDPRLAEFVEVTACFADLLTERGQITGQP